MEKKILTASIMIALLTATHVGLAQQQSRVITHNGEHGSATIAVTKDSNSMSNTNTVEVEKTTQTDKGGASTSATAVTDENGQLTISRETEKTGAKGNSVMQSSETVEGEGHSSQKQVNYGDKTYSSQKNN